jgi:hypothetical protein
MRHNSIWIYGIALSLGFVSAQQLMGPVEGFVFDAPSQSFREVLGLPGSASLGPALVHGFSYGSVAPHRNYAIAFKGGQAEIISDLDSAKVSVAPVPGLLAKPEGIAWAGNGSLAVAYSRTGNWIQSLTEFTNLTGCLGLKPMPHAPAPACGPRVSESVDVSSLGGSILSVAVDFQGKRIAIGTSGAETVYLSTDNQAFSPVLRISDPISLSFSDDDTVLYALDRNSRHLSAVNLGNLSSQKYALDGLADPVMVKSGRGVEGTTVVYVASGKDRILRVYDPIKRQTVADFALDFKPSAINDLGPYSFMLAPRERDHDPLWLFTSAPRRGVYFVPALPSEGYGK